MSNPPNGAVPFRRSGRTAKVGRVDYRRLAGDALPPSESENSSSEEDNGNETTTSTRRYRTSSSTPRHANRHIGAFLDNTFSSCSPSSSVQILTSGSELTCCALMDPQNPLSIHRPIVVKDTPESIGMKVPRPDMSVRDIGELVGMERSVTVMDVSSQEELDGWTMADLVEYFEDEDRVYSKPTEPSASSSSSSSSAPSTRQRRVLNQISLEFSNTPFQTNHVRSPQFVRDLDWIDHAWPSPLRTKGDYPCVQYYCLTSTAGCFTDFHVDFGGTSVWYQVLQGRKIFLMAPPSKRNMESYEKWLCSSDQSELFYPDLDVEGVVRVDLRKGETLHIPTGWIHGVYTPDDSVVVGGNYLHGLDIPGQLDVHCVETRTRVPSKFRFPHFVRMMFYAGASYLGRMRRGDVCHAEVKGMNRLVEALRAWAVPVGGDADRKGGVARAAKDAADISGCKDVLQMLDAMEDELERIAKDGIVKKPRIKLPLSSQTNTKKLRLKIGKISQQAEQSKQSSQSHRLQSVKDDQEIDTSSFRISLPSAALAPAPPTPTGTSRNKKKRKPTIKLNLDSDLAPSSQTSILGGDATAAACSDDEWLPDPDRCKKRQKPSFTANSQTPLVSQSRAGRMVPNRRSMVARSRSGNNSRSSGNAVQKKVAAPKLSSRQRLMKRLRC